LPGSHRHADAEASPRSLQFLADDLDEFFSDLIFDFGNLARGLTGSAAASEQAIHNWEQQHGVDLQHGNIGQRAQLQRDHVCAGIFLDGGPAGHLLRGSKADFTSQSHAAANLSCEQRRESLGGRDQGSEARLVDATDYAEVAELNSVGRKIAAGDNSALRLRDAGLRWSFHTIT
jgi:hypothetical protein